MQSLATGQLFVFGVRGPLPLRGWPAGKIRLRLRATSYAVATVRTDDGARRFAVIEHAGAWMPGPEVGRNMRGKAEIERQKAEGGPG